MSDRFIDRFEEGVDDERREAAHLAHKTSVGNGRCDANRNHVGNLYRVGYLLLCSECFDVKRDAKSKAAAK